ncbi:MAG: sialidase family protein [Mycobacteriales bacterium]
MTSVAADEPEVLFPEARRRRRRRRLLGLAVAGALGVSIWAVLSTLGGAGHHRPPHISAPPKAPQPAGAPQQSALGAALDGKYVPGAVAFTSAGQGVITVGGSPLTGEEVTHYWMDRTSNGGRSWVAEPATIGLASVSADPYFRFLTGGHGWAYGTQLFATADAGRHWQVELPGMAVRTLANVGSSTWVAAIRCPGLGSCQASGPVTIYATAGPGSPFVPLASQPAQAGEMIGTLLRANPLTGWALLFNQRAVPRLVATDDGGAQWSARSLPSCGAGHLAGTVAFAAPGTLWALCTQAPYSNSPSSAPTRVYQSTDGGRTWQQMTAGGPDPVGGLYGAVTLAVTSPTDAWAVESNQNGRSILERTTDRGQTWTATLNGTSNFTGFTIYGLTAQSSQQVEASIAQFGPQAGRLLYLATTTNAGRTWARIPIPAAPGTPTVGHS